MLFSGELIFLDGLKSLSLGILPRSLVLADFAEECEDPSTTALNRVCSRGDVECSWNGVHAFYF
jgi:hypothetical protein